MLRVRSLIFVCASCTSCSVFPDDVPAVDAGGAGCVEKMLVLSSQSDAYITSSGPTNNFGSEPIVAVELLGPSGASRALIAFDSSSVTDPSSVTALRLRLSVAKNDGAARQLGLYALKTAWAESEVSWSSATDLQAWAKPGADFDPLPVAVAAVPADTAVGGLVTWEFLPANDSDGSALPAFGWVIADADATVDRQLIEFGAREGEPTTRPELQIDVKSCE